MEHSFEQAKSETLQTSSYYILGIVGSKQRGRAQTCGVIEGTETIGGHHSQCNRQILDIPRNWADSILRVGDGNNASARYVASRLSESEETVRTGWTSQGIYRI